MGSATIFIPRPVYNHPIEIALLERLNIGGEELVAQYLNMYTKDGVSFIGRDAAKRMFPEYLENPTLNNRYADGAASAIADAARRTVLASPIKHVRNRYVLLTGSPASGKTTNAGPGFGRRVEIEHETILTSFERSSELIQQARRAGRVPILHLFYTDNPRLNVQRMIKRARRIGRTVPLRYMAKMYLEVPKVVQALRSTFGDDLVVEVTNNSAAPENMIHHNQIERAVFDVTRYTQVSALEAMYAELDKISEGPDTIPASILEEARRI